MTRFCLNPLTLTTWIALGVIPPINTAQAADDFLTTNTTNQTLIQAQDARNQALLEQLVPNPSVVVDTVSTDTTTQTQEQPTADNAICFDIHKMGYSVLSQDDIVFADKLGFALVPEIMGGSSVLGKCMTVTDINAIATRVQNRLIEQGYVTSRIMVGDQNLADGELRLTLIPGKIAQVVVNTADSKVPVYVKNTVKDTANQSYPVILDTALTTQPGKLLNIRDLETTLENFKRVPSADATFKIAPSDELQVIGIGFSDILIDYTQHRRIRGSLSIDDSGSKSTGKYQGVATLSVDNLANLNDLFYLSFGRDLGNQINDDKDYPSDKSKGSKNYGIGYVIPIKNRGLY
ncbi:hypothetical protein NGM44_01560 [Moraxella sp. FZFQ2102]|uniref:ShlB/FhaC/HecB family hemolysin secretion/activation protein n=1 Tax=Moraxella sp. FZFQ2102 TaxID=2953752 RepID=UPI00209C66F1|nr:ShlB/FhaC/HecB family hemolysin secretion/activation protein [Moraxella sp. FZFQ2102]USZ15114.1 hypothetical protein NGM44_01560 [Moraxella sp. FZFQ2102]